MKLTKEKAFELLCLGLENPNEIMYVSHCRYVGNLAGLIAKELGLDSEYATTLGYLHDIGRRINNDNHIYAGYKYLVDNGYEEYSFICLTHSFLNNDMECIAAQLLPEDTEGYKTVKEVVESHENSDYDRIIQVCDLLCVHTGGTTMEERLNDIESRRGTHSKSAYHREIAFKQKEDIEKRIGHSIYYLYDKL